MLPVNPRTDNVEAAHSEEKCPLRAHIFLIPLLSQLQLTVTIMVNQEGALQLSLSTSRRSRLPWRTTAYDDEVLLREILVRNPGGSWRLIHHQYNDAAPASRQRSVDSVTSKGKSIQKEHCVHTTAYWCEDFVPQSHHKSSESTMVQSGPVYTVRLTVLEI